jgi:hypothetical protein
MHREAAWAVVKNEVLSTTYWSCSFGKVISLDVPV